MDAKAYYSVLAPPHRPSDKMLKRLAQFARQNPLPATFICIAVVSRLVFWAYTGRIWEDALITITAARNVWEGVGLTHHASEPRVHSFTSPISVLIPLLGEGFHAGLLLLRLASIGAAMGAIYFAWCVGVLLRFHWSAQVLVLTYLACDQLQIFFGMAGMETQVVTAIALAVVYFYLCRRWLPLGLACGLAAIGRPEFVMFLLPTVGVALMIFHWRALSRVAAGSLLVAGPWYLFAQLYYGSIVPNTIVAKSLSFRNGFLSAPWSTVADYVKSSWCDYVPFREMWIARSFPAPLPDSVLQIILALLVLFFSVGVVNGILRKSPLLVPAAAVIAFLAYRDTTVLNSYYMWYLPPFLALAFLVAGSGLSELARRLPWLAAGLAIVIAFSYAMHMPFSFPLDRQVQRKIELGVRARTGQSLAKMMGSDDTAVLEPLGFIGWAARNKTIFDFPGLGSKVSVRAVKGLAVPSPAALIDALQPTYAVVRPNEFDDLTQGFPATAAKYDEVARFRANGFRLRRRGYEYGVIDNDFRILKRTRDFDQTVHPPSAQR